MFVYLACLTLSTQALPTGWHKVELTKSLSVVLPEHAGLSELTPPKRPKLAEDEDLKYWAFTEGKISFVIGVSTFTAAALAKTSPDQILGNSVRGSLDGLQGSMVKSQRDAVFNGWPAVDFTMAGQDLSGVSRSFMVGKTMYQLLEVYPSSKGRPEGTETYLNSLTISPSPPPGPLTAPGPVFQRFAPDEAKCSVNMPATPKPLETKAVDGSKAAFTQYVAEYGNRVYMLCYVDVPKGKTRGRMIKDIIGQLLLAFDGKQPTEPDPVKDGDSDFVKFTFARPDGDTGRADVSVLDDRAYVLIMLYPPGHAGSPDIGTFFDSFKLLRSVAGKQ